MRVGDLPGATVAGLDEKAHTPLDPTKQYLVIVDARLYFAKQMTCGMVGWPFCPSP